ncbi:MAG: hypothetical protein D6690_06580 [Nitrospirae bacterium]|nr:MAG: hypothetical protein D6690_06580 [Nitrospirota bacterium]
MNVTPVPERLTAGNEHGLTAENVQALGREVFLRLLVTQLQSQDPTNPVTNEDFIVQLAQFTTLEQANNTNDLLASLVEQNDRRTQLDLVKLIGHDVVAEGDVVSLGESGPARLTYVLGGEARTVEIRILDTNGTVRQSLDVGPQGAGSHDAVWDGNVIDGDRAPAGSYRFQVIATDSGGGAVPVTTFLRDTVKNVLWGHETPVLTLASGKTLSSSDIISVERNHTPRE